MLSSTNLIRQPESNGYFCELDFRAYIQYIVIDQAPFMSIWECCYSIISSQYSFWFMFSSMKCKSAVCHNFWSETTIRLVDDPAVAALYRGGHTWSTWMWSICSQAQLLKWPIVQLWSFSYRDCSGMHSCLLHAMQSHIPSWPESCRHCNFCQFWAFCGGLLSFQDGKFRNTGHSLKAGVWIFPSNIICNIYCISLHHWANGHWIKWTWI